MPYKHSELQSNSPYYDDFEDAKNFLKVLFKPGYAVQARELTQLQSILQSQISKFADHIFVDGSQVIGGKINVSPVNYIRVNKLLSSSTGVIGTESSDTYLEGLKRTVTSYNDADLQTNQIIGTIEKTQVEVYKYDTDTGLYATESSGTLLMLHYEESGYSVQDDYTVLFFLPLTGSDDGISSLDLLKIKDQDVYFKVINPTKTSNIFDVAPFGTANIVSVDDGIFYLDGLFVKNYNQILVPYYDSTDPDTSNLAFTEDGLLSENADRNVRLFTYPTVRVGLTANKTAVTVLEDSTLRDPASGFYNSNAPGADRYTINLVLSQLPFDTQSVDVDNYSNSDFIQLARLVNGKVDWIRKLTNYSEILEIFARRTYDESGSYTVVPFQLEVKNHLRDDYYEIIVKNTPSDFSIGTYIFSQNGVNPFQENLSEASYGVLEVINITPYDDLKAQENLTGSPSIVRVRSKNSTRVAFDISSDSFGYGILNYRSSSSTQTNTVSVKLISYQVDPTGTYSTQDIPVGDSTKMVLAVQPGKAYVYGYEYENSFPKNVEYLKNDNSSTVDEEITVSSSSLLGNYVIGSFQTNQNSSFPDWELLPKFKLNSEDLFVLVMEQGQNTQVTAPIYSWSPYALWTSDNTNYMKLSTNIGSQLPYESVIFVQDTQVIGEFNSQFFTGSNNTACNGRSSPYNYIAGQNSRINHKLKLVSSRITNVVKASFIEEAGSSTGYHQDFIQAYDPTNTLEVSAGNSSTTANTVVKQLDSDGNIVAQGYCYRFVAGNDINRSDAYIQQTSQYAFISSGPQAGVLYQDNNQISTSWGSSISRISQLDGVYKITTLTGDSTEGISSLPYNYVSDAPATNQLTEVQIRRITDSESSGTITAKGYIFASLASPDPNTTVPQTLYLHILESNTTQYDVNGGGHGVPFNSADTNGNSVDKDVSPLSGSTYFFIEAVQTLSTGSPCFRYLISSIEREDVGYDENTFKRVDFIERSASFDDYDPSVANASVYQFKWDDIDSSTGKATKVEAKPWSWIRDQGALYIQECNNTETFERKYGPVYQIPDPDSPSDIVVWGNRGLTSYSQFDDKLSGRFINIKHDQNNLYVGGQDYTAAWAGSGGEPLVQVLQRSQSYDPASNYVIGEKIFQIRSGQDYDYSSATVISWEYPNITDPSDTSAMKLVARIDKTGPAQPGNYIDVNTFEDLPSFVVGETGTNGFLYEGKIFPYSRLAYTDTIIDDWYYSVNNPNSYFVSNKNSLIYATSDKNTSPVPVTVGTTRIRNVSLGPVPQTTEDTLYKFYLFDTELTETNNIFGDVTHIIYDDDTNSATTTAKIAPISGRKLVSEIFQPTGQTIQTRKTTIYDPSKDKLFFRLPTGKVFEEVLTSGGMTVELQRMYNNTFGEDLQSWVLEETDEDFLTAEPNINWFVIDNNTGQTYNLIDGTEPSTGEIGYVYSSNTLTLYPSASGSVTLFAKTSKTISVSNIRKKHLDTKTEYITGFTKGSKGSLKNQYYMDLMSGSGSKGTINSIITVFAVDSSDRIITGTENIISSFSLDTGVTDQKIGKPKLILGSAYVKSNGKIDGSVFGSPGSEIDAGSIRLKITYEYYAFDDVDTAKVGVRESFITGPGSSTVLSNFNVPFYYSKNDGAIIHESTMIDFRPNLLNSTNDFTMGNTKFTPHPDWADGIQTTYYLPRRDKLILTKNGKFEVLYGKPSLEPKYPSDVPNSMSLYLIDKDPFIFGPGSIKTKMLDNRRYTMRDIGKIEKRVQKLEYYTTLSIMEKKAEDMLVLDANGNDRFKNGILVDTFEGHKIGDVTNRDYNIAIDFGNKYARPPFITHTSAFIKDPLGSTTFTEVISDNDNISTGLYMFPYTEKVFVAQPLATRAITVQPHDTIQYEGLVTILPLMDTWVSTNRRPDVNVNLAGENDAWNQMVSSFNNNNIAPFGTQWGEWETLSRTGSRTIIDTETSSRVIRDWHLVKPGHAHGGSGAGRDARTIENTTVNTVFVNEELEQIRNGITRTLSTSTTDISLGDRIVDVRLIPFMREKNIKISARGLKPKTRVYVFFDGVNVAEYCYKFDSRNALWNVTGSDNLQYFPFPGSNFLPAIGGVHFATGSGADLKTNDDGEIFIEFRMPDGVFRVGDRKLEITSDPRNDKSRASTYASAVYSASGLRTEVEETIATTRNFQISDPVQVSDSRTTNISGIFQESSVDVQVQTRQNDPLAQTFFVNADEHPEGIFLSSVDIFFARKPEDSTNLPVQVQIRPSVNGYPDSTRIYPGGKVVKLPSQVQVSEDASVKTNFKFDHPIHLPPGEHALVVKGDTSEYEIYIATLGDFILGSETKVTNQPYVGVFFTSANASTWSAEQNTDMMMVLNKCEFTANSPYQLVITNEPVVGEKKYELFNINSKYFDFNSCRSTWSVNAVTTAGQTRTIFAEPNTDVPLNNTFSYGIREGTTNSENKFQVTITAQTSNKDVSPVIDLQCLSLFAINNKVENNTSSNNGELEPFVPNNSVGSTPRARYITRVVTLQDGFDSSSMKCVLSVNKPIGTNIQVFAKMQDSYSTDDFHSFPYVKLTPNVNNFDTYYTETPDEFREVEFVLPQDTATPFNRFCVKICLYSDSPWNVPKIRDLRAVAVL
jgi:hypothetical protein